MPDSKLEDLGKRKGEGKYPRPRRRDRFPRGTDENEEEGNEKTLKRGYQENIEIKGEPQVKTLRLSCPRVPVRPKSSDCTR